MSKTNRKGSKKAVKREAEREVGYKKPPVEHQFTTENQPDPKLKSRGWTKKKAKDAIIRAFDDFALLDYPELLEMVDNMKRDVYEWPDGKTLTVTEVKALKWIMNNKMDQDFMNRGLSYAKTEVEHSGSLNISQLLNSLEKGGAKQE